jgi:hypothetical protein
MHVPKNRLRAGVVLFPLVVVLAAGCGGSKKKAATTSSGSTTTSTTSVSSKIAAEVPAAIKSKGTVVVAADAT